MMKDKERIISFPHMGNYHIPFTTMLEKSLGLKVIAPPPITKKTIDLGAKNSPDFVCVPFKYNLGNYIETLDRGANILMQAGAGCRFGFYSEVQDQILKDLGYDFEFLDLMDSQNASFFSYYREIKKKLKKINPGLNFWKFNAALHIGFCQFHAIESIEKYIRENIGFESVNGSFEKLEKQFYLDLKKTDNAKSVKKVRVAYESEFKKIPVVKPEKLLKVGLVGELYLLMDPFSSYFIERELALKGIEVRRYITLSYLMSHDNKKSLKMAKSYLKYHIGADGTDSVARSKQLAEEGFDGIIHVKPFGCTPETNAMPAIQKISRDYNIPVLFFSFDAQASETGVKTRLEAFHDMLVMRKEDI